MFEPQEFEPSGYKDWVVKTRFRDLAENAYDRYFSDKGNFKLPWFVTASGFASLLKHPGSGVADVMLGPGDFIGPEFHHIDTYNVFAMRSGLQVKPAPDRIALTIGKDEPDSPDDAEPWKRLLAFDLIYRVRNWHGQQRVGMELDGNGGIFAVNEIGLSFYAEDGTSWGVFNPPRVVVPATVEQLQRYTEDVALLTGLEN